MVGLDLNRRSLLGAVGAGAAGLTGVPTVARSGFEGAAASTTVYVGSDDGTLYAVDAETGEEVWAFDEPDDHLFSSPTVVDGIVYVGSADGTLYAVDAAAGELEWSVSQSDWEFRHSPAVADGTVYATAVMDGFGVPDYTFAFDAETGEEKWVYDEKPGYTGAVAVADGAVYLPSTDGILALDASTGEPRWEYETEYGYPQTGATVADGKVITAGVQIAVAVDVATGEEVWTYHFGTTALSTPTVYDGIVFFGVESSDGDTDRYTGRVEAVDAETGEDTFHDEPGRWRFDDPEDSVRSSPTARCNLVYAGSEDGALHAGILPLGEPAWAFTEPDGAVNSSPTVFGDTVYVGSDDGTLYAVDAQTGEDRWAFQGPEDSVRSSPTVVADPADGHSAGSRVALGTLGHHDREVPDPEPTGPHLSIRALLATDADDTILLSDHRDDGAPIAYGEEIEVLVSLANLGEQEATETVELRADGEVLERKDASIDPCVRRGVEFSEVPTDELPGGDIEFGVEVDDDSMTDTLTVERPPYFEVTDLDPETATVTGDDGFTVSATVENLGSRGDSQSIELRYVEDVVDSDTVELDGRESTSLTLGADEFDPTPGDHEFEVATEDDAVGGTVTVEGTGDEEGARDEETPGFGIIGTGAALLGGGYLLKRRTEEEKSP